MSSNPFARSARRGKSLSCGVLVAVFFSLLAVPPALATADLDEDAPWMHRDRLFDVTMVGKHAWVIGYPGIILHSADGGETWEGQTPAGHDDALLSSDFIDEKTGWIVGRKGLVLRTTDGGATWTPGKSGTPEPLLSVDFVSETHGWAVGNFGVILHTADGGKTWQRQTLGEGEDPVLNAVSFVSTTEGWVAGEFGTLAHTTDGGKTWEREDSGSDRALFGLAFRSPREGIAVGSAGTVLVTTDGGATWTKVPSGTDHSLFHVHYDDARTWACGRSGMVVKRAGSGLEAFRPGPYVWLAAVAFNPDGVGLIVGRAGTIMRSADDGATWSVVPIRR